MTITYDHLWFLLADESKLSFGDRAIHSIGTLDDIPPGHERILASHLTRFDDQIFFDIKIGVQAIYFWGTVEYQDVFGARQTLQFRRKAGGIPEIPTEGEPFDIPDVNSRRLALCSDGNSST